MDEEDFGEFSMPEQYGQSYAPDSLMSNLGYSSNTSPDQSTMPSDFDALQYSYDNPSMPQVDQFDQSYAPGSFMSNIQQQTPSWGMSTTSGEIPNNQGGISQVLSDLFNNKRTMTGIGAFAEGIQNLFKANAMNKMTSQMQGKLDPFGNQRPFYQQQLQRAMQDPYSAPIVRDQVAQLQRMQAIKDAAAGRRSNGATSSPALLAAQAQIAQKYLDSLMTPAGANISPSGLSSLIAPQTTGINAGINNFISPAITAMQRNNQEDLLQKLLKGG